MWLLFYIPWGLSVLDPAAGLAGTTLFVVYHWCFHKEIVQRIEVSMLPNPINIYLKNNQNQNGKRETTSCKQEESCESTTKVEADELQSQSKSDAGGAGENLETSQQVSKKIDSPYIWDYASW